MDRKNVVDLSPIILKVVSILSIILVVYHVLMDLIFIGTINMNTIIPLVALYIFCEYFRKEGITK